MRPLAGAGGLAVLALAWAGVPAWLPHHPFTAHMTTHMAVVAIAAPFIALAVAGTRLDPVRAVPALFAPIPASMVELVAVWGWHAPTPHQAARTVIGAFVAEQATFLAAGLLLWLAVLGGDARALQWRRAAGVGALLFTSIHMTLLGALFALAPRTFYAAHAGATHHLSDLHLGGAIMLIVGGASYMSGGLAVLAALTRADGGDRARPVMDSAASRRRPRPRRGRRLRAGAG